MKEIIGVIGAGTMGAGIAQVAATAGCVVKLFDLNQEALSKSKSALEVTLSKLVEKGKMAGTIEFNTLDRTEVKSSYSYDIKLKENTLMLPLEGNSKKWQKVDEATESLAGNWRITAREQSGTMTAIKPAARKTIKILSGTRFQWAAINMETGEFFGTGGGHYTYKDGAYTEHIEFFSRDASRVGASLSFKAEINNGEWHHSGLSSKGDKIHEVWSRK